MNIKVALLFVKIYSLNIVDNLFLRNFSYIQYVLSFLTLFSCLLYMVPKWLNLSLALFMFDINI